MSRKRKLFGFNLNPNSDYIEIGGGEGELSLDLKMSGFNMILFIEPDFKKFVIATKKLNNILCLNSDIKEFNADEIKPKSRIVTIIMQDVIEHISKDKQKIFFQELFRKYAEVYFIGRTPNLKSPFGMRNSFGDNTHIHRFTDNSLRDFLFKLDFTKIHITHEDYKITGITSLFRYPLYLLNILSVSLIFLIIFGCWEGFLTPNIVFKAQKINKKLL
tara:strand:- start:1390 stop:2040 length:651 start_codon:yes stop_codon:yes gene_type:complete